MNRRTIEAESSPGRRAIAVLGLLAAAIALARCGDDVTGPGGDALVGVYAAATTLEDGRVGEIVLQVEGLPPVDLVDGGAGITLILRADGTTGGRLLMPSTNVIDLEEDLDVELNGRWHRLDGTIRLDLDADVFLRDLPLVVENDGLAGEATSGSSTIRVKLGRIDVDPDPGPAPGPVDLDGLALVAGIEVTESFHNPPQQALQGTLEITNPTDAPVTFDVGGCPVFLQATSESGSVWDQRRQVACVAILRRVTIAPGETIELRTPAAFNGQILTGSRVSGTYRISVILPFRDDQVIAVQAGTVAIEPLVLP